MQAIPVSKKLAWLAYLALAVACVATALVTLVWFSGIGILIRDAWGLAIVLGTMIVMSGGVVAAATFAFRRRIYWAWAALAVAYAPFAIAGLFSLLANP